MRNSIARDTPMHAINSIVNALLANGEPVSGKS